jgi:hypothetical protein
MGSTGVTVQHVTELLVGLTTAQQASHQTINGLGEALQAYLTRNEEQGQARRSRGSGPKVKEPGTYDGDQSEGKLDDHIREL